jgi:hypothetical protein
MIIDGKRYECELDDSSVSKLINAKGDVEVIYQYTDGFVSGVYGVDENGMLIDKSDDCTFIGNLNQVTYNSYYYDQETGWYYCGRYYDVKENRFIDGQVGVIEAYLDALHDRPFYSLRNATVQSIGNGLYEMYIDDASFGTSKSYTIYEPWYSHVNILELCARTIYAENPYISSISEQEADRKAVAWVIWNRKVAAGYNGYSLRLVLENDGHFTTVTGSESDTKHARKPDTTIVSWDSAVRYACYLYAAEYLIGSRDDTVSFTDAEKVMINNTIYPQLVALIEKPMGITTQTSFRSFTKYFEATCGKTNIALAGVGSWETATDGEIRSEYIEYRGYTSDGQVRTDVNIFFNEHY